MTQTELRELLIADDESPTDKQIQIHRTLGGDVRCISFELESDDYIKVWLVTTDLEWEYALVSYIDGGVLKHFESVPMSSPFYTAFMRITQKRMPQIPF